MSHIYTIYAYFAINSIISHLSEYSLVIKKYNSTFHHIGFKRLFLYININTTIQKYTSISPSINFKNEFPFFRDNTNSRNCSLMWFRIKNGLFSYVLAFIFDLFAIFTFPNFGTICLPILSFYNFYNFTKMRVKLKLWIRFKILKNLWFLKTLK